MLLCLVSQKKPMEAMDFFAIVHSEADLLQRLPTDVL